MSSTADAHLPAHRWPSPSSAPGLASILGHARSRALPEQLTPILHHMCFDIQRPEGPSAHSYFTFAPKVLARAFYDDDRHDHRDASSSALPDAKTRRCPPRPPPSPRLVCPLLFTPHARGSDPERGADRGAVGMVLDNVLGSFAMRLCGKQVYTKTLRTEFVAVCPLDVVLHCTCFVLREDHRQLTVLAVVRLPGGGGSGGGGEGGDGRDGGDGGGGGGGGNGADRRLLGGDSGGGSGGADWCKRGGSDADFSYYAGPDSPSDRVVARAVGLFSKTPMDLDLAVFEAAVAASIAAGPPAEGWHYTRPSCSPSSWPAEVGDLVRQLSAAGYAPWAMPAGLREDPNAFDFRNSEAPKLVLWPYCMQETSLASSGGSDLDAPSMAVSTPVLPTFCAICHFTSVSAGPPGRANGGAVLAALDRAFTLAMRRRAGFIPAQRAHCSDDLQVDFVRGVPLGCYALIRVWCRRVEATSNGTGTRSATLKTGGSSTHNDQGSASSGCIISGVVDADCYEVTGEIVVSKAANGMAMTSEATPSLWEDASTYIAARGTSLYRLRQPAPSTLSATEMSETTSGSTTCVSSAASCPASASAHTWCPGEEALGRLLSYGEGLAFVSRMLGRDDDDGAVVSGTDTAAIRGRL